MEANEALSNIIKTINGESVNVNPITGGTSSSSGTSLVISSGDTVINKTVEYSATGCEVQFPGTSGFGYVPSQSFESNSDGELVSCKNFAVKEFTTGYQSVGNQSNMMVAATTEEDIDYTMHNISIGISTLGTYSSVTEQDKISLPVTTNGNIRGGRLILTAWPTINKSEPLSNRHIDINPDKVITTVNQNNLPGYTNGSSWFREVPGYAFIQNESKWRIGLKPSENTNIASYNEMTIYGDISSVTTPSECTVKATAYVRINDSIIEVANTSTVQVTGAIDAGKRKYIQPYFIISGMRNTSNTYINIGSPAITGSSKIQIIGFAVEITNITEIV